MRSVYIWTFVTLAGLITTPVMVGAQQPQPDTRIASIERAQAEKSERLSPYVLPKGERVMNKVQDYFLNGLTWRPYLESAYPGGGFPFGVGYRPHVSPYSVIDIRGSYTFSGYKLAEAEFFAPRLFDRRGTLSVLGGWREATEVAFHGIGPGTVKDSRTNYDFRQPYLSALVTVLPTRRLWTFAGGLEWTQWDQRPGHGGFPSTDTVFTPETLPGLDAKVTWLHTLARAGIDTRPFPGYSRRGGWYGVTVHDYEDTSDDFGFERVEYEALQHIPILRESWVLSLRGRVETAYSKSGQETPFFMLPSLGGGTTLRGYSNWRFRDRTSLLMQAEWRVMVNRFFDTALFYDTGKVAPKVSDLDFTGLRHDFGVGFRFHGPDATMLRVDLARSGEGTRIVFGAGRAF